MDKDWFDNLFDTVTTVSKKATRNANYIYNIKKTELEISKVNHEIGKIYKAIGEVVYNVREEESDSSNIEILCKQIDVKKAYIAELKKRIDLWKEEKDLETTDVINLNKTPKFMTETEYGTISSDAPVLSFDETISDDEDDEK